MNEQAGKLRYILIFISVVSNILYNHSVHDLICSRSQLIFVEGNYFVSYSSRWNKFRTKLTPRINAAHSFMNLITLKIRIVICILAVNDTTPPLFRRAQGSP